MCLISLVTTGTHFVFDFRSFVCLPVLQSLMLYFYNLAFTNFKDQTIEVYIPPVLCMARCRN